MLSRLRLTRGLGKPLARHMSAVPNPIVNPEIKQNKLFINNEFVDSTSGKTFETLNPATGEVICRVAEAQKEDVDLAITAANKAFALGSEWRTMDAAMRGRLMYKLADAMQRDRTYISSLECLDSGKLYKQCYSTDLHLTIECLRYYAGWADKYHGKVIPISGDFFCYTKLEPVGVCGQIIPWNFPMLMLAWKLGPALSMGNTVVVKPAEQTPLTALYVGQLAKEVGFPAGVLNILTGDGPTVGAPIVESDRVDKVAFTGSTEIGRLVSKNAAPHIKSVTLELGGKSPVIIMDDANLENAVQQTHFGLFFNQGQCCCAGSRVYVQAKVYDRFVQMMTDKVKSTSIGDPFDMDVEQGPQVDNEQFTNILGYIDSAKKEGATLCVGGAKKSGPGYFIEPTVFSDVTDSMTIAKEEIFGPVMSIMKFDTMEEVIDRANDSEYGLAAGIFSQDVDKINVLSNALRGGTIWINSYDKFDASAPFGGFKGSGIGRELGEDGLKAYTEVKTVITKIDQKNS